MSVLDIGALTGYLELDDKPFGDGISGAFEKLKGFGGKGALIAGAAGAAIAGALGAALAGAMDIEAGNAKLQAQLGLNDEQAARMGTIAGRIYSGNYGDSLSEVNDALAAMSRSVQDFGDYSDGEMVGLTENVLSVADAFGVDAAGAVDDLSKMVTNGLAPDVASALDIMTKGLQGPANKAGDLLETFEEYPVQFQKMGLSGQDALGLISQGMQNGARDSDIIADAIKEFSIRAVDGSALTKQGFEAIGLSAETMQAQIAKGGPDARAGLGTVLDGLRAIQDPAKRSQAAVMLFGTQAEDMGNALYSLDLDTAADGLGKIDGAAQAVNDTLSDTAESRLASFKRAAQQAFVRTLGGAVLPVLEKAATWLQDHLGPAIAAVIAWFRKAVAAGGVLRRAWQVVFAKVADFLDDNHATFERWWAAIRVIWIRLQDAWAALWVVVQAFWDRYGAQILSTMSAVWSHIANIIGIVWDSIKTIIDTTLKVIRGIIETAIAIFQGRWGDAWGHIQEILQAVWDGMLHLLGNALEILGQLLLAALDALGLAWQFAWDAIKAVLAAVLDTMVAWVAALPGRLLAVGALIWDWIREKATHIAGDVAAAVVGFFAWVQGLPAKFASWGAKIWSWFVDQAGYVLGDVITALTSFFTWVRDLPSKLAGLVGDAWSWLVDQAKSAGARAWEAFKDGFIGEGHGFSFTLPNGSPIRIPFLPFAEGGIVSRATPAIVGEAGPEAILPLDRFQAMLDRAYVAGQARGGDGASIGGRGITVYQEVNYPQAAPASATTSARSREMQLAGALAG